MVTPREEFQQQQASLGQQRTEISQMARQPASKMQLYGTGLAGRQARRKATRQFEEGKAEALGRVREVKVGLEKWERETLVPYEQEVAEQKRAEVAAEAQYQKELVAYNQAIAKQAAEQAAYEAEQVAAQAQYAKDLAAYEQSIKKQRTGRSSLKEKERAANILYSAQVKDYIKLGGKEKGWAFPTKPIFTKEKLRGAELLYKEQLKDIEAKYQKDVDAYLESNKEFERYLQTLPPEKAESIRLTRTIDILYPGAVEKKPTPDPTYIVGGIRTTEKPKFDFGPVGGTVLEGVTLPEIPPRPPEMGTVVPPKPTTKQMSEYAKFQQKVSGYIPTMDEIAKPISEWIGSKHTFTPKEIERLKQLEKVIRIPGQIGVGIWSSIQEKPVTVGLTTAAFAGAPAALGAIGWGARATGVTALAARVPTVTKILGTTVKIGLPIWYGSTVYTRVMAADNVDLAWENYQKDVEKNPVPEGYRELTRAEFVLDYKDYKISKGETFGRILGAEVIPMGAGGYIGAKYAPKVMDYFKTKGRTEIPPERVITPEVLTGKTRFPEIRGLSPPQKQIADIRLFKAGKYAPPITRLKGYTGKGELIYPEAYQKLPFKIQPGGYHATGIKFWKGDVKVTRGESQFAGLYTAPSISTYFLRTAGGRYSLFGGKLFEPYGKPGVAYIKPTRYVKGTKGKPGEAFIPGIKPEVEAIVTEDTLLEFIGGRYYFKFGGRRVPVDMFKTTKGKIIIKPSTKIKIGQVGKAGKILSSYKIPSSLPITTPGSYLLASVISYKPSYKPSYDISYKPSKIKKVTPSYISGYKPSKSKPTVYSYRPSGEPSRPTITSYKPSPTPSKPGPIIPSYTPSRPRPSRPSYIIPPYRPSYVPGKPSYTKPTTPRTTLIPPIRRRVKPKIKKVIKGKQRYQGQTKVKRKWTNVGKAGPRMQTIKKTRQHVDRNIAASVRIMDVRSNKAIKLKPSPKFRLSKSKRYGGTVLVEKRKYRLDTKGEGRQIKAAPKKLRRKKKR